VSRDASTRCGGVEVKSEKAAIDAGWLRDVTESAEDPSRTFVTYICPACPCRRAP
jgi:hypothetical protein